MLPPGQPPARRCCWADPAGGFVGLVAGLQIANRALSSAEIAVGAATASPDVLREIHPGPTWAAGDTPPLVHRPEATLVFDGHDDYVRLPSATALGLTGQSFTVECWVRTRAHSTGDLTILGTDRREASKGLHLVVRNGSPYLGFFSDDLASAARVEPGAWHHLAFRFDAPTRQQAIIMDGQEVGSRTAKAAFLGEDPVHLGRWSSGRLFAGALADLRIWREARPTASILDTMRNHRQNLVVRAAVDGSGHLERLGDVPAEGGLCLTSKAKAEHEQRLVACRARRDAQAAVARQVADEHAAREARLRGAGDRLATTHREKAAEVVAEKARHEQERSAHRASLAHAQAAAQGRVEAAKVESTRKRDRARTQAESITADARKTAASLKQAAQRKRDEARAARDRQR